MNQLARKPRILFVYERPPDSMPPYVRADYDSLAECSTLAWMPPCANPGWRRVFGPRGWLPDRTLRAAVRDADLVLQWFATAAAPAIAARILGKPLLLVVGGHDTAGEREVGYGLMLDPRWRAMVRTALNLSSRVLALSRFQLEEVKRWAPRARASFLHLGVNADAFAPTGTTRHDRVVTTCRIGSDWVRKGLETFVLTARLVPEVPFAVLGPADYPPAMNRLKSLAPANVTFSGALSHADVPRALAGAKVYAQLSWHESFCLALAEAMAVGCSPVATRCGALPEVAGDCARYVPPNDPEAAAQAIRESLAHPLGSEGRQRIVDLFPPSRRRDEIRRVVNGLLDASGRPGLWEC